MRLPLLAIPALSLAFIISGTAQMGDPSVGPTKIPNQELDPTRPSSTRAVPIWPSESMLHQPLPEQYIWTKEDPVPENPTAASTGPRPDLATHYFRRAFVISSVPPRATLYLAGPRSATIYLNGKAIGSYQLNLDFPMGIRVYACDVTQVLRPGKNILAIQAVRGPDRGSGADTRLSIQQTRGEVLAAKIVPAEQGIVAPALLISDAQWKASMHVAPGWQTAALDDRAWAAADSLGGIESSIEFFQWNADAGMYAWPGYDGISPFLDRYPLPPDAISHVYSGTGKLTDVDVMAGPGPHGEEFTVDLPAESVSAQNAPQILLDFGREVVGRIQLQSDSDSPADVVVQYGESEPEAFHQPYLGADPIHIAPHSTAYGPKSAFRYALVRFTSGKSTRYKSIRLDGIEYPVTYYGSFSSSDPALNQMWTIGAYTAHLCMQDDIWDAPKRDRGRWMGDLDVSGSTIEDVFGPGFLMEDTLDRLVDSGRSLRGISTPFRRDVNGIPGYSAFWVIGEAEYVRHSGLPNLNQLQSDGPPPFVFIHTRLIELLHYMETELDQRDLFANQNHSWPFVDWSPELYGDTPESRRATQFEFYAAFRDGAWLLRQMNDTANADLFQHRADALKAAAQKYLLDSSGSYGTRWQTNAYAVLSGIADPSQYAAIWSNALSGVGHVKYNALIITPYYNYYVISAMAKMGHRAEALNWIRQYWGGMTDEGATSFWEGYDPSWYKGYDFHASLQADQMSGYTVSLAHGWSSGVTPWLMEELLGIHARAPGFSRVDIRPDLIDLQWAKGAEPTPHGMLAVSIRKESREVITIDLPPDTTARVSVAVPSPVAQVLVNGTRRSSTPAEDGHRAIVTLAQAGHYEIESR